MMAHVDQLVNYFVSARGIGSDRIGTEIETFFVRTDKTAITVEQSQQMLRQLVANGWVVEANKGEFITEVRNGASKVLYELGYPNLELAVSPDERSELLCRAKSLLGELYEAGASCGAYPLFRPIYAMEGNFLALPDERDATWLSLDGKAALSPLARISAVQFTINVPLSQAIQKINRLLSKRDIFLESYPQDRVWRQYIGDSEAGYRCDRYGGPSAFDSLSDYCERLSDHAIVAGDRLIPFADGHLSSNTSISLFIRSIWWYFRLRRYGENLCIEVRPIPREEDECLDQQLDSVLEIME